MYVLQMARLALRQLARGEEGATAVEYGLIVGLIAVVIAATLVGIGADLGTIFTGVKTNLGPAVTAAGG
jgi:pilus assembly protein Flp/PilA